MTPGLMYGTAWKEDATPNTSSLELGIGIAAFTLTADEVAMIERET